MFEKLAIQSAQALVAALDTWVRPGDKSQLVFYPQPMNGACHAPMLSKSDGQLNWQDSARSLFNRTRGVTPWPGAQTTTKEGTLKIKSLTTISEDDLNQDQLEYVPGTVIGLTSVGPMIRCGDGAVVLTQTQRPSKKATSGADFYRGYPLTVGILLSEC